MQDKEAIGARKKVLLGITKGEPFGGAQEYVYSIATSLPQADFDVSVLIGAGDSLPDKLKAAGIRVLRLPDLTRDISLAREIRSFFDLIRILREERPHIFHTNSSKMGLLGAAAGRIARVPLIIFTAHGWAFNERRPIYERAIFFCLHWLTVFLSHRMIAVSAQTKKDIATFGIADKITIIHNGIGPISFLTKTEAQHVLLETCGLQKKPGIMVGTISELHSNKGLDIAIEAMRRTGDGTAFLIIGSGEEKESLEKKIRQYNLEHTVFLLGRIEHARTYLKAFDIFTLTSRTENLPFALLEAGLAGIPIIASKVGGIPDIIDNRQSGILVTPGNPGEVSRAIDYLVENPDQRKLFSSRLKAKISKEFSAQAMLEKTIEIYEGK